VLLDLYEDVDVKYRIEESAFVGSWMFDLQPQKSEKEIREELKKLFSSKLPLIHAKDFEFVKCERNNISNAPLLSTEWNSAHLKHLIGQGKKLYCRLKCLEANSLKDSADLSPLPATPGFASSSHDHSEILDNYSDQSQSACIIDISSDNSSPDTPGPTGLTPASLSCINPDIPGPSRQSGLATAASSSCSPDDIPGRSRQSGITAAASNPDDIPGSSWQLGLTEPSYNQRRDLMVMQTFLNDVLDQQQTSQPKFASLEESLTYLNSKFSEDSARLSVDRNFLLDDALSFYKSDKFIPTKKLKVRFDGEPAVDTGGVTRQFFSDLFEIFETGADGVPALIVGESGHKLPTYDPSIAGSDLMETLGKIIAHCIAQTSFGISNLSPAIYSYLVNADFLEAVSLITIEDISSVPAAKDLVEKVSFKINLYY